MKESSTQMYDRLLSLPLFLGMSQSDLHEVAAHTPLAFSTYAIGSTIVSIDDVSDSLLLLIQGDVMSHMESYDREWTLDERLHSPYMHQPEHLFGWHQRYTRSLRALTPCQVLRITKHDVLTLLSQFQTIRFNLLNTLCIRAQRMSVLPRRIHPTGIAAKLQRWIDDACDSPMGEKTFHIRMTYLAQVLGESRLNLSRCLHRMEEEGLLSMRRGEIHLTLPLNMDK
ncbi:MAG: Crp/Fnr family transcriptional regulator [Prevotella sp.]|nr:Crp/Fnr family transcriptional regulator [Prevotella sp.]